MDGAGYLSSRHDAVQLARRLSADGVPALRRGKSVLLGTPRIRLAWPSSPATCGRRRLLYRLHPEVAGSWGTPGAYAWLARVLAGAIRGKQEPRQARRQAGHRRAARHGAGRQFSTGCPRTQAAVIRLVTRTGLIVDQVRWSGD